MGTSLYVQSTYCAFFCLPTRAQPTHTFCSRYPYNGRSIFTPEETKDIGMGIVLWRGYFQSARPAVGRMLVNVDISTGAMHKPGNVLDICLQLLGLRRDNISAMHVGNLSPRDALKLSRFLAGVRVISNVDHTRPPRTIRRIMDQENASMTFTLNQAGQPPLITTIAVRVVFLPLSHSRSNRRCLILV